MQIKVGQLTEHLAKRAEGTITAKLGEFTVNDDATVLSAGHTAHFVLDESANHALARYLKIPPAYFDGLTPDFRATTLRYFFDRGSEIDTVVESLGGNVMAVHQPSQVILPLQGVAEVITKVLKPEDTIRRLLVDDQHFHLDATTSNHNVAFYDPSNHPEVGDITEGGLRILSYPYQMKPPSVSTYIERLFCTNGMVTEERLGQVTLKGRTVPEVLVEMELAANLVMEQLDNKLADYAQTREMPVPGSPQAFVAQLAREAKVSRQVLDAVLDIVNQLPEPVTVWDVNNAFTSVANQVSRYATMTRLQTLGGSLAFEAEKMVQRCGSCERLL
jgi:hypothetical protein